MRLCECGCGLPVDRPNAKYAYDACKSRAWRERAQYVVKGVRVAQVAWKPCQTRKARTPDMRVNYSKAVEAVVAALTHPGTTDEWVVRGKVKVALRALLSDAAREHLDRAG